MKSITYTFLLVICFMSAQTNAQTWQWVAASTNSVQALLPGKIVSDDIGNTYSIGTFSNTLVASPSTSLISAGNKDIFLIKRNAAGTVLWAKQYGGAGEETGIAITIDKAGDVITTGKFSQSVSFGTATVTAQGGFDVFIAKINSNGNTVWAKSFGGPSSGAWEAGNNITTDTLNNIYVTGIFYGTNVTLAPGIMISSSGSSGDMYVLKMDQAGNCQWARKGGSYQGGFDYDEGLAIKVSPDQNSVIVGGSFHGLKFIFDTDTIVNTVNATTDSYIISLNTSNGSKNFIRAIKGANYTDLADLALDNAGNIYVTGYCESNTFNEPPTTTVASGVYRVYVFKYDQNGTFIWSTGIGNSTYGHEPTAILVNHHNKIIVGGYYNHHLVMGSYFVNGNGMFLATLDTNKTALGLVNATTYLGYNIYSPGMTIDTADNVYFNGSLPNGPNTFGTIVYNADGDVSYCAKYGNPTSIVTGTQLLSHDSYAISIFPNPASGDISVISDKIIESISVTDVSGKEIEKYHSLQQNSHTFFTRNWSDGIYFVFIGLDDGSSFKKKIIVNH